MRQEHRSLRNQHRLDEEYAVRLRTVVHHPGQGDVTQTTLFDGSAHRGHHNEHFWTHNRDWRYTFPEGKPFRWIRVRALGGKTNCWAANTTRWGPLEFKAASFDGYDADWPVSYEEMSPWYSKAERLVGVAGPDTGSAHMPAGEWMTPPGPRCGEAMVAAASARKTRIRFFQMPKAVITKPLNGRSPCHYCGRCSHGCDPGSKFTSVGTLLPPALPTGRLTIRMNATVREVTAARDGRANGVSWVDRYTFREGGARAKVVIVAASAIETARLLLNSGSSLFPNGLANSSGQVGRNLVDNVTGAVSGYLPQLAGRRVVNEDSWGSGLMTAPFVNIDDASRSRDFIRRYFLIAGGGFGMGTGAGRDPARFGEQFKRAAKHWYGTGISITGTGEGIANADNFVDIDPSVKDAWGIPAARIHFEFGENEQRMVNGMTRRGRGIIEAAGGVVTSWQLSPSIPGGQIHEQGACRMGDDRNRFVTNRWGQCHDVPNLFLADGSLHVTASQANPTLTILALSMRNAEHLAEAARRRHLRM